MNERIKLLRKDYLRLSQKDFANKLELSENFVWMIENGLRIPSSRTISDICREFNVDRAWLETGVGEPFVPKSRQDVLRDIFADVLSGRVSEKNAFIEAVSQLPDDVYPVLVRSWIAAAEQMKERLKNEKTE